jgi:hypothetical protein
MLHRIYFSYFLVGGPISLCVHNLRKLLSGSEEILKKHENAIVFKVPNILTTSNIHIPPPHTFFSNSICVHTSECNISIIQCHLKKDYLTHFSVIILIGIQILFTPLLVKLSVFWRLKCRAQCIYTAD